MEVLLLALTLAPGLAIAIFVYYKDKFDREPLRHLIWAFLLGVVSAIPAVGFSLSISQFDGFGGGEGVKDTLVYAFITVAFAEELAKFIFLRRFYRKPFFDEPFDGITYAVMIGMGFATLENLLYVFVYSDVPYNTALMRMLTAVPAHASFAVIMGYFVGLAKFKNGKRLGLQILGLLGAIFFHGMYDFLLMLKMYPYMATGALVSLVVGIILSFKAIRIHQRNSPFNPRLF
jgi:RsiW-degrading membrane proteinase PrsW (M82 family)